MDLKRLFSHIPTLTTDRLQLREITSHDARDVFLVFKDEQVTRFNTKNAITSEREARKRIIYWKQTYTSNQRIYWGIFHNDVFIGNIGLVHFDLRGDRLEIGYNLGREYWGKGLMKEAITAVLNFIYKDIGVNRVDALVLPGNENSIKLLQSLQFTRDGLLRGAAKRLDGTYEDVVLFGLLKNDFNQPDNPTV